jgi:hypothetical protein
MAKLDDWVVHCRSRPRSYERLFCGCTVMSPSISGREKLGSISGYSQSIIFTAPSTRLRASCSEISSVFPFARASPLCANSYTGDSIPPDKLRTARERMNIPPANKVFAICDATSWGSAKLGVAICETGMFWRNAGGVRRSLSWPRFMSAPIVKQSMGKVKIGEDFELSGGTGKRSSELFDLLNAIHTWFLVGQVGAGATLRSTVSDVYSASGLRHVHALVVSNQTCSDLQLEFLTQAPTDKALELIQELVRDFETPNGLTVSTLQLLVRMLDSLHVSPILPGYPDRLRLYHLADVIRRSEAIPALRFDENAYVWTQIGIDHHETIYEMTPASMMEREPSASDAPSNENGIELRLPRPGEPFIIGASQGGRVVDAQWVTRLKGVLFLTDERLILHPAVSLTKRGRLTQTVQSSGWGGQRSGPFLIQTTN